MPLIYRLTRYSPLAASLHSPSLAPFMPPFHAPPLDPPPLHSLPLPPPLPFTPT